MFERLQTKWKVNGTQLFLVLCVFALGGSATGWLGKIIMNWLSIDHGWLWTLLYIIVVTLIWPINVLLVSIPFGQFAFFTSYLARMGRRMKILKTSDEGSLQHLEPERQNAERKTRNAERNTQNAEGETQNAERETQNAEGETQNAELKTQNSKLPADNKELKTQNSELRTSELRTIVNIAIFASGTGSNANKIIEYFHQTPKRLAAVKLIVCNKPEAGVLEVAKKNGVPTLLIEKEQFFRGNAYIGELSAAEIHFIVLAGFLWKIPQILIDHYRNKIVNIHPALLPKYGGKGMYGSKVHEAVINSGEKESGITIHYVDEHYDNGDIIFQDRVAIENDETPESLANKIHNLEHAHYPRIVEQLILQPNGR